MRVVEGGLVYVSLAGGLGEGKRRTLAGVGSPRDRIPNLNLC
jgi:hypothetical protein